MTAEKEVKETLHEQVSQLMMAMCVLQTTAYFCAQPESFPVYHKWLKENCKDIAGLSEDFMEMLEIMPREALALAARRVNSFNAVGSVFL